MKRQVFAMVLLLWLGLSPNLYAGPLAELEKENYSRVMDSITSRIVADLPDNVHMRLLAIGPVEGDDGTFLDGLTEKIKAKTRYHLIERQDLNRLLEEQGVQLSPVADDRRPVEPGRIKGVEALIMARFMKSASNFLYSHVDIFAKMDNVETGSIVFAKHYNARHWSIKGMAVIGGLLAAVLIFSLMSGARKKEKRKTERFVESDDHSQMSLTATLKKAAASIDMSHDRLVAQDRIDLASPMAGAGREIRNLVLIIEQTPGVRPEGLTREGKKQVSNTTKAMQGLARNVHAEAEKIYSAVSDGNHEKIETLVARLQEETKNCKNRFQDR